MHARHPPLCRATHRLDTLSRGRLRTPCRCSTSFIPSSALEKKDPQPRTVRINNQQLRTTDAAPPRADPPTNNGTSRTEASTRLPPAEDFYLSQPKPLRPLPWYHYPVERKAHDTPPSDLFMSRLAMVGFSVSIAAEALTGRGPLSQLNIETGIPLAEIDGIVVFLIAFNVATVLMPRRRDSSYFPEEEELEPESSGILYESSKKVR